MDLPAVQLLCLEQEKLSLESHTCAFLDLACLTSFPDRLLSVFFLTSLNVETKARLPSVGPRGNFAEYVEWVLVNCGSAYTIGPAEDDILNSTAQLTVIRTKNRFSQPREQVCQSQNANLKYFN